MIKLYFITTNRYKFLEAKEFLTKHGIHIEQKTKRYPEIQAENLDDVVKYAIENISDVNNFFIEDSGLFIKALRGFPGVYSKYVYNTIGLEGILKLMNGIKSREAYFISVIGLKIDNKIHIFKGKVEGYISNEIRGDKGFGYDPIFIPRGYNKTFAEDYELKKKISHRKLALEKMAMFLRKLRF